METGKKTLITVEVIIHAPVEKVWRNWTEPGHITGWYNASDDWHTPFAENDLREGGRFRTTMAARDGSMSFDFEGTYTRVREKEAIDYTIVDGRKVSLLFMKLTEGIQLIESFETETLNPAEMQRAGWQAILDNFKKYTETNP